MPGRAPTPCPGATAWQCMNPAGVSSAAGIARIPHQAPHSTVNPAWSYNLHVVFLTHRHMGGERIFRLERFPLRRSNAVAAVPGVVRAFVGGEEADRDRDQIADLLKAPRPRGT